MDYRDDEVTRDALERLSRTDAMLMGRGTYELFSATWPRPDRRLRRPGEQHPQVRLLLDAEQADWSNSTIVRGDAMAEVTKLKQQDGQDLALYGHGLLAQTLLDTAWSTNSGSRSIPSWSAPAGCCSAKDRRQPLKLVSAKTFGTGVVVLSYELAGAGT